VTVEQRLRAQDRALVAMGLTAVVFTIGYSVFDKVCPSVAMVFFCAEIPAIVVSAVVAYRWSR
jgi:hypothetical protein